MGTSASRLSDYQRARTASTTDVLERIEHVAEVHAGHQPPASRTKPPSGWNRAVSGAIAVRTDPGAGRPGDGVV